MDPESLDWIWEGFNSLNVPDENDYRGHDVDVDSDSSSESVPNITLSLLTGDSAMARELNQIVNDIKKQYGRGDDRPSSEHGESATDTDEYEDYESADKYYIDALEAAKHILSEVRLVWSDTYNECVVNEVKVSDSHSKTTSIEKLIILDANNFIEQFKVKYPNRMQLVLIHENECGAQKCICTTIKPSRLVYHDLNDLISYSEFVANHITYIKLENSTFVPKQIVSPATTLQMQTGHCFELAILLVSFLIGCGYNAFVVQGYATENICNNDQTQIKLDLPKSNDKDTNDNDKESEFENIKDLDNNYDVDPMLDLCSEYVTFLLEEEKNKSMIQKEVKTNDFNDISDPLYGKRVHSWVIIMPSDMKDNESTSKDPYFIEPSTGEQIDISNENYIGIEAIWNHNNYWVNLQASDKSCAQYSFNLSDLKSWEHFLPDEPVDLSHIENISLRHLIMPNSWVNALEVPRDKYLLLYPTGKKIVSYMNALKESYGEYIMPDGLIEKTTFYAEPNYVNKILVKEIYKHRTDNLISIEKKYTDKAVETVEYFNSGRPDLLKMHKYSGDGKSIEDKRLVTFYNLRLDSIVEFEIDGNSFVITFKERSDLLFWRMCVFHHRDDDSNRFFNIKRKPVSITDKYLRDESKHKDRDMATVNYNFLANNIYVQYQYGEGQITQSSRLFDKPAVTSSDEFDPKLVTEIIVYPYDGYLKTHEAYILLQDMIKAENEAVLDVSALEDDIIKMLKIRNRERSEFKLKINALDWDRNYMIRDLLQTEKDKKLAIAKRDKSKKIEYALPHFEVNKPPLKHHESLRVRNTILKDFKQSTLHEFIRTEKLFMQGKVKEKLMLEAIEKDNFKNYEEKKNTMKMCSRLKSELDVLFLKLERYKQTHVNRYNSLVSYLNTNPYFKMLEPLELFKKKKSNN